MISFIYRAPKLQPNLLLMTARPVDCETGHHKDLVWHQGIDFQPARIVFWQGRSFFLELSGFG